MVYDWGNQRSDEFYLIFVMIMINNVLNFVMSIFAIYMLEKISRAHWSIERKDSKEAKQTTQMDRVVAAGWFDYKMIIRDYVFRNFTHNIPPCDESLDSNRSSFVSSRRSSMKTHEENLLIH